MSPSHVSLGTRVPPSLPLTPGVMGLSIHLPLSRSPRNMRTVGDRTQEPAEEEAPGLQVVGDRTQELAEEEAPGLQLVGDRTQEPAEEEAPG